MASNRNIITLEYNAIEAQVFARYFDNHQYFNYLGNYHIDSTLCDITDAYDTILININTSNYRRCVSFLRDYPRPIACRIFLTSNVYFNNLTWIVHNYNAQIIMKPIREDCLFHLINQPALGPHLVSQLSYDVVNSDYLPIILSFSQCSPNDLSVWTQKAFQMLAPKQLENESMVQANFQMFATLFIYFVTQDLETQKIIELTRYYNELLQCFKSTFQLENFLKSMEIFFKNCYNTIHPECTSIDQKRIYELKLLIQKHIDKDHVFSLETIALEMSISASHLSRIFKKNEKITLRNYIQNLRLNKACYLLSSSDETVEEIALRCGYQEISSFSRAFKNTFSLSPFNYRKKHSNTP